VLRDDETVQQEQAATYMGEHRAVQLQVTLPQRLRSGFDYYTLSFDPMDKGNRVPIGNIYPGSAGIAYTQNGVIFCDLPQLITNASFVRVQVEAHRQVQGQCVTVAKSASFVLEFEQGIAGQGETLHTFALGHINQLMAQLDSARGIFDDIDNLVIPPGPQGPQGPQGPVGPTGPTGGTSIDVPNTNLNEVRAEGIYRVAVATTNAPVATTGSAGNSAILIYYASTVNRGTQLFYHNNGRIFSRAWHNTSWTTWREIPTAAIGGGVEWITPHRITFPGNYFDRDNLTRLSRDPFGMVYLHLSVMRGTPEAPELFPNSGNAFTVATLPEGFRPHTQMVFAGAYLNRTSVTASGTILNPSIPVRITMAGAIQIMPTATANARAFDLCIAYRV